MKKGDILELEIEKVGFGGKGIARIQNQVIFVENTIPGDKIIARIRKIKKNYIEANLKQLIAPSELREEPRCSHFGVCGGCKWQNLNYSRQLEIKREHVLESLQHIGGFTQVKVNDILASPLEFAYRNKMEYSFTDSRWLTAEELKNPENKKDFALGLHVPGSYDRIMHIDKCWLADDVMNQILNESQEYFKKARIPVFNLKTHQGQLKFLVLRKAEHQNEYMVNVVTHLPAVKILKQYAQMIYEKFPQVKSIINTVNRRVAQIAYGEEEYLLYGETSLKEKLGEFEFEISANSFFQTNSRQAARLYQQVMNIAGSGNSVIWDLYSGTGTIALYLSRLAEKVVGFELIEGAVKDAYANCSRNNIENCEFIAGDIRSNIKQRREIPDIIICDPPRSGMHPEVVSAILEVKPKTIIYVSCNPATMARDIKIWADFYRILEVQPVDMFPHTYHIESVVKLELK